MMIGKPFFNVGQLVAVLDCYLVADFAQELVYLNFVCFADSAGYCFAVGPAVAVMKMMRQVAGHSFVADSYYSTGLALKYCKYPEYHHRRLKNGVYGYCSSYGASCETRY